jgi:GAF domain-containing protein
VADADDDLAESLTSLSELLLAAQPHDEALRRVAEFAVHAVPGCDGCGIALFESAPPTTLAASHRFVRAVDEVQYALTEGPCVDAVRQGRTVVVVDLADDARYAGFGPQAVDLGVRSSLSLPLQAQERCIGALNLYAHRPGAFDDAAAHIASVFAGPAGVVLANARLLEQSQRLVGQMREAMSSRAVIEQAKGVLMAQHPVSAEEAFARLRHLSQVQHLKLHAIAQRVVDDAAAAHGQADD